MMTTDSASRVPPDCDCMGYMLTKQAQPLGRGEEAGFAVIAGSNCNRSRRRRI